MALIALTLAILAPSIAIGVLLVWCAKRLIGPLIWRAAVMAIIRGLFYSPSIVVGKHIGGIVPSILAVPQWIDFASRGTSPIQVMLPALGVAAASLIAASAGFGLYRSRDERSALAAKGITHVPDSDAYAAALERLGPPGAGRSSASAQVPSRPESAGVTPPPEGR